MKQIDLEPDEYKTEPRPDEPIFGPGWPVAISTILAILVGAYLSHEYKLEFWAGIASVAVFGFTLPIFTALVSDRQLQVRPPPRDPPDWR